MARFIGTINADFVRGTDEGDYIQTFEIPMFRGIGDPEKASVNEQGADTVWAGSGNDLILSGGGGDWLWGCEGNDTLVGGTGKDWLAGGGGADVFNFALLNPTPGSQTPPTGNDAASRDVIIDFEKGVDRLDVSGWLNKGYGAGTFTWAGKDGFTSDHPELVIGYHHEGYKTVIDLGRYTFDSASPQARTLGQIEIVGIHEITLSDFIW